MFGEGELFKSSGICLGLRVLFYSLQRFGALYYHKLSYKVHEDHTSTISMLVKLY